MSHKTTRILALCLLAALLCAFSVSASALYTPIGQEETRTVIRGLTCSSLPMNAGPGTKRFFKELGTYGSSDIYVPILAKAWDPNNGIWWVKVEYPEGSGFTGWTGYKRFYASSFNLDDVPTERWYNY